MKKTKIIFFGAAILCITMMTASANVFTVKNEINNNYINVVKMNVTPKTDYTNIIGTIEPTTMENEMNDRSDTQVTSAIENELNPAIGIDPDDVFLLSYVFEEDSSSNIVPWTFSVDGGATWDPGVYYDIVGTESHPAISYRGSEKKFAGTMECDPYEVNGAIQYTFMCDDPTNTDTYELTYIEWGASFPYSYRRTPDVGGYTLADKPWWYGVISVVGTRGSPGSVDMPIFNYANYEAEGSGWSSYFADFSGCENTAVDVDLSNGYLYAAFDYLHGTDWDILLMRGDCNGDGGTPEQHILWFSEVIIGDAENTKYPAVGALNNNVIILAQSDEAGTQDIVCYYSSDAGDNWQKSYVATDTVYDELYPAIVSYGPVATCTFIMNGDLYYSKTDNGGQSWSSPTLINDVYGTVESDFRNVDITKDGTVIWTDNQLGNLDLFLDNVGAPEPPGITTITGPATGKPGVPINYDFEAVHPNDIDIAEYIIDWGDGNVETLTGPFGSGVAVTANHTWAEKGQYNITAKAKDILGLFGPEGTLSISIPRTRQVINSFFIQWLKIILERIF